MQEYEHYRKCTYNKVEEVKSVQNSKYKDIGYPEKTLSWNSINPGLLAYFCKQIHADKSGAFDKADVFINGIGISVKSRRGAAPSIINQTSRDKILRVMKAINSPIAP